MPQSLQDIKEREKDLLFSTYARYPIAITKGEGTRLYDLHGKEYIDLLAGISVCNLGHSHPELVQVIQEQANKLIHVSNLFYQEEQLDLAEKLLSTCALQKVFFCNSGAEANEAAIKLARRYMQKVKGRDAFQIVSLQGSFHGRTLATVAATGQDKVKDGFFPLPTGFVTIPFLDIQALSSAITQQTAAVIVEIIQGEGGVRPLTSEYLQQLQLICQKQNVLLIVDEVQTGMARTGKMWAYQHFGLEPDIVTSAKALANGLPMGAMLATNEVSQGFEPGSHAATFGGGALVSAVASKVLDIIERDDLCKNAHKIGDYAQDKLLELQNRFPKKIIQVRGKGLMLGIELDSSGEDIWRNLLRSGFICNLTQQKILRLLPPLTISFEDIEAFIKALSRILESTFLSAKK